MATTPPPNMAQWQLQLQPWLNALAKTSVQIKTPSLSTVSDADDAQQPWISLLARVLDGDEGDADAGWLVLVEAMEILELLARVDEESMWCIVTSLSPYCCSTWVKARYKDIHALPRFKLGVDEYAMLIQEHDTLKGLQNLWDPPVQHSPTYAETKNLLLAKWAESHGGEALNREKDGYVSICLKIMLTDLRDSDETDVERVLAQIETLVRSCHSCVNPGNAGPFFLSSLVFGSPVLDPVPTAIVSSINSIGSIGIPLANVGLSWLDVDTLDRQVMDEFLETHVASPHGSGLSKLTIASSRFDTEAVEAFCLAIAHSRNLRRVECGTKSWYEEGADDDDFIRWLWLAYALFSRDATHEIHTVGLNMEVLDDMRCVDGMRRVLNSADPLACVYEHIDGDVDDGEPSPAVAALLSPSAVVHRGRHDGTSDSQEVVAINASVAYRVVNIYPDDGVIEVEVPLRGMCWCKRSDVLETIPVVQRESHSVRHLRLVFVEAASVVPSMAFLELVGGQLERLSIEGLVTASGEECTRFFHAVLTHCPNLKRLDLKRGSFESLLPLCDSKTKLESLYLDEVKVAEEESLNDLFATLSNPTEPLALSLRELHVDCGPTMLRPPAFKACFAMLEQNHRLRRCELVGCPVSMPAPWRAEFSKHDGEPVKGRLGPLPQAETLAFLSVTSHEESMKMRAKKPKMEVGGGLARHKLDIDTLRLILELAALPPRRTCILV